MCSEGKFALGGLAVFALWLFVGLPLLVHPPETEYLFGLSAHGWIAFWTFALTIVTGVLAWVAWHQIGAARDEAKLNRTLAACDRYDLDPILDAASRRLHAARESGDLAKNPKSYRLELWTILNYLESLAIGIDAGLYDIDLVRRYMEPICRGSVEEYVTSGLVARAERDDLVGEADAGFEGLISLCKRWSS